MSILCPWFYRHLLGDNTIIETPEFFKTEILNGKILFEAICSLNENIRPTWISKSEIYNNRDGAGTSPFKNVAVYKAISEALERWAFYEVADSDKEKQFCFDENPTTTGMAAYPGLTAQHARENAILEAQERWALHEFWRGHLSIIEHRTIIKNLYHYQIITPFQKTFISLLSYKSDLQYLYSFAAGKSLADSFEHALIELARNIRVMKKFTDSPDKKKLELTSISDRRIYFFSTVEGNNLFREKIISAPISPKINLKLICDAEIKGPWSKYTKVWRYLYANSYHDSIEDYKFFMF